MSNMVQALGFKDYNEYLDSWIWKDKRDWIIEARGGKCEECGSIKSLNVHHLTYEHVCQEKSNELIVLCKKCHNKAGKLLDIQIREVIGAERYDQEAKLAAKTLKDYCFELGITTMEYRVKCLKEIKSKIKEYELR